MIPRKSCYMNELKTCFKRVDYDLAGLLHYLDIGDIGLPDIQRPFVWSNAKVRDLFDSMYRGFPVGYFLFWENTQANGAKQIGVGNKPHTVPSRLIVDGQQRLTSLYAVFRGKKVLDENYRERQIEIAFRPRDGRFDVADAAIRRDSEWIANISELWASGKSSYQMVKGFLKGLQDKTALTEAEEEQISHNLDRLFDLQKFPFTALEIASSVDEEQVADIFVRINSEGVKLNQADFILTLLSVFWDEGRAALERFCRASRQPPAVGAVASPYNHFIEPDPDQLLRVSVALGFERGRLKERVSGVARQRPRHWSVFGRATGCTVQCAPGSAGEGAGLDALAPVSKCTDWSGLSQWRDDLVAKCFAVCLCILSDRAHPLQGAGVSVAEDYRPLVLLC